MNKWMGILFGICNLLIMTCGAEEEIQSLLLFGDSYFDTGAGNIVSAQDGVPLVSPTPTSVPPGPYFDGRHSNGPIWIDYTSEDLELPVTNFAVAGAETGFLNVNTLPVPPFPTPFNPIGGLFQQLDRFRATGKTISHHQLVVVDGAGNNFLALVPNNLSVAAVTAAATQALTDLGTNVLPNLQRLGAQKIVLWNLGDLSMLPLFNSPVFDGLDSPAARALMHGASVGFNTALIPVVKKLNSQVTHFAEGISNEQQIFIFDAYSAFNTLAAELVAEGKDLSQFSIIASYGGPFIPNPLIPAGTDPNSLPFFDQVHPTTASWQLFSRITSAYLDTLINAPRFVAASVDLALETSSAHRDVVDNHLRTLHEQRYIYNCCCNDCGDNCCNGCIEECCNNYTEDCCTNSIGDCCNNCCDSCCGSGTPCFQVYVDGEGKWGSTRDRRGTMGLNYDTQLGLIGADWRWCSNIVSGVSFTYQTSHGRIKNGYGKMDLNDSVPTLYTTYFGPNYFIDIASSLHCYQFKHIKRNIPFLDRRAKGHTHGLAPEMGIDVGYVGNLGCLTYMPLIGVNYESLVISRYRERHAAFLDMKTHRQYQRSLLGIVGAQLFYRLWNNCTLAFAEIYYEHEFLRNKRLMSLRFVDSADGAIDYNHTSQVRRNMIKYSVGLDTKMGNFYGNVSYIGETNFQEYSNAVRAELGYAF